MVYINATNEHYGFIGAQAQETVRGVVTDAAGEPLIGAMW